MMQKRNIKFRAWNNKSKEMLDWLCICQSAFNRDETQLMYDVFTAPSFVNDCGFTPMQFTGLQDSKGVDIYEGDIVRCHYGTGKVIFHVGCFMVEWIDDKEADMEFLFSKNGRRKRNYGDVFEVIGNVFQNPELCA